LILLFFSPFALLPEYLRRFRFLCQPLFYINSSYLIHRPGIWDRARKIPKSDFLLRYVDDVSFRQAIEKQMNKIENANKFSRAIAFGNNQSFLYGDKIEQEMAEGCRRLIKNAIICWNSLYLTQRIAEADSEERRHELLEAVKNGSVAAWQHVNMQGEYDFSDEKLQDSVGLYLPPELDIFGLHTDANAELGMATH
jgi:hypothetical protein